MFLPTQPYKGTRDFYPPEKRLHNWAFGHLRQVIEAFGFEEYDGPMLESFELYAAKSGEELVNQQLYTLEDRGGRKLAMRPEMTPTLARMIAGKFQELPKPLRWYSIPNLWRYERPQRGRLREHWQLNVDLLGGESSFADLEILTLAVSLFRPFQAEKLIKVCVNSRKFMNEFFSKVLKIDDMTALKVSKLIDGKAKMEAAVFESELTLLGLGATQRQSLLELFESDLRNLSRRLNLSSLEELENLMDGVEQAGLSESVIFDPSIMRGMDYYTGLVFEAYDVSPENRRALFGGGRYDNLMGLFGKNHLSGIGFGLGDVSLLNFLETHRKTPSLLHFADIYIGQGSQDDRCWVQSVAAQLREQGFRVITGLEIENFGQQLRQASKLGARFCLLRGNEEKEIGKVALKNLVSKGQETLFLDEVPGRLNSMLSR